MVYVAPASILACFSITVDLGNFCVKNIVKLILLRYENTQDFYYVTFTFEIESLCRTSAKCVLVPTTAQPIVLFLSKNNDSALWRCPTRMYYLSFGFVRSLSPTIEIHLVLTSISFRWPWIALLFSQPFLALFRWHAKFSLKHMIFQITPHDFLVTSVHIIGLIPNSKTQLGINNILFY